ncbi:MsnO8 family LLM class oxidoreductase [Archangium sp.]|uniref:MsnO8 family LLM class oxidoreductase n=1 Tax=Archangium sp. TaxID=1872627 RepID=UPI00286B9AA2|nr:MsnO8 family LLM class oxidoreductase [Archangium sp.]
MQLGLLDFCALGKRQSPVERVFETVQLVQDAEALGYSRYWLSEHHELSYAHHSPELLAAILAGGTERIRVGVAGMLLLLHSPMRVAKSFRLMSALYGGRVDLGMGSGTSADAAVLSGMRQGAPATGPEEYLQRVQQLLALMRGGESSPVFNPLDAAPCPLWILGTGTPTTPALAARLGTCFGLSLSFNRSRDDPSLLSVYRNEFRPTREQPQPQCIVSVAGVCAETQEEALRLAEAAPENPRSGFEVVGTPAHCHEKLEALRHRYGVDELIFLNMAPDQESRRRSLQLLAEELRLTPSP